MSRFRYTALDATGADKKGDIEAGSEAHARALLRNDGLIPLALNSVAATSAQTAASSRRRRLSQPQVIDFTKQLSELLAADLPLERALANLAAEETGPVRRLIEDVRERVASGLSLSAALGAYPKDFPEVYRSMVEAGEASGAMAMVMQRLSAWLEARAALRQRLIQACLYPAIVVIVAIAVVSALLAFVVPQVVGVFAGARQKLPPLTVITLMLSHFLRAWWLPMACATLAGAWLAWTALRRPAIRAAFDGWVLGLPVIGRLTRDANAARFGATLGALAGAGVPILKALQGAAHTLGNQALRADAEHAANSVREGGAIARALAERGRFPPTLITFIGLGEQTGQLARMADQAAARLAASVERRTLWLVSVLEPALILAMGAMVLLIVLAVLLPIVQLNTLVR